MSTPIEYRDIREGDVIRDESRSQIAGHRRAIEYVAKYDGHSYTGGDGPYFLIDRPTPPVQLPEKPTLGWLTWTRAGGIEGVRKLGTWEFVRVGMDGSTHAKNEWGHTVSDIDTKVTAFEPATAIPTDAIDELRRHDMASISYRSDTKALQDFLAAVDAAGSQS